MSTIYVHLLPTLTDHVSLTGSTAVVIDVLRASTTMIHALANGATAVVACLSVDDAQAASRSYVPSTRILGGERRGELIPGFDLDNSPLKYTPEAVGGKTIFFTTTNGTRALLESINAANVCVGAFVNRKAIVRAATNWGRDLHLVCAGTDDRLTAEDILFAGAVANDLLQSAPDQWVTGGVQTQLALDFYRARSQSPEIFRKSFLDSLGARNLLDLGMGADIERAMQNDLFDIVPVWSPVNGQIRIAEGV